MFKFQRAPILMDGTANIEMTGAVQPRSSDATPVAEVLRTFWRQKYLFTAIVLILTGLAALAAFQIAPKYTSTARILVTPELHVPSSESGRAAAALKSALSGQRVSVYSEIEVMRSDRLIEKVIAELDLSGDPEFNPALQPGMFAPVRDLGPVKWLIRTISPLRHDLTAEERAERETKRIVDSVRSRMVIRPPGLANVIAIQFQTSSAAKSAQLANGFVNVYSEDRMSRSADQAAANRLWLDSRIGELKAEVDVAERKVAEFIAASRLDEKGSSPLIDRRIVELGRQLSNAKSDLAEKRVRLLQLRKLSASGNGLESTTEVQSSRTIQKLRDQETVLVRRAAELDTRFGAKHPTMINLRADIENTRKQMISEQKRIVDALANEVRVAQAGVRSVENQLKALDVERAASNEDRVQLIQMQREALASRKLYEMFVERSKAAEQASSLKQAPIQMIAPAKPPTHPSYPKKPLIIAFGFFLAVGFGILVILLLEKLDGGFRSVSQVERVMHSPSLGIVPRISGGNRRHDGVQDAVVNNVQSPFVEAIRSLRTSLLVASSDVPPKVVLIASAQSGDGKTSLAVSLARLSAIASLEGRVLLIDGDLRKPAVAPGVGAAPSKGLMHLFSGEATLDEVIVTDEKSGLHILPSVPGTPNPPELLNSTHMRDLLAGLRNSYDMIIIDSPALDAVSDARVLAHYADTTVFVVRWEATKQLSAINAMKQLTSAGARVAGIVMQQVNIRKSESYGYREAVA